MTIIYHNQIPPKRGYYSKILNRKVVSNDVGAKTCEVWDQTIPPGGYIVPHYHDFEETLTFLNGSSGLQITIDHEVHQIETEATVFIPPGCVHSVQNQSSDPVRLLAFLVSEKPKVIYIDENPLPVEWE